MDKLNIKNKRVFISVLNNLANINRTMIIDGGTDYVTSRSIELSGRRLAIAKFKDFKWTRSFQINDITKLTNAMGSLPDSDVILEENNIVVKKNLTSYDILYSELFNDSNTTKDYKLDPAVVERVCTKENLVFEFILTDQEITLIRNSERTLNFKDKYIFIIDKDGVMNGKGIDGDRLIYYTDSFKIQPEKIIFNDLGNIDGTYSIELADFIFLPKMDYKVRVYSYIVETARVGKIRCFTTEVSYSDDDVDLKYYINNQAVKF